MKKFFYSAVVALALLGAAGAPAQTGVRVGPAAEEAAVEATPAPKRDEKKTPAVVEKNRAADKADGGVRTQGPAGLSNATAAASTPVTSNPSATTDAPPEPGSDKGVPVGAPVRTSAGAEAAKESDKTAPPVMPSDPAKSPNGPAAAPNTTTATPNTSAPNSSATAPKAAAPSAKPAATSAAAVSLANIYRVGVGDVLDIRLLNGPDPRQSTLYPVVAGGVLDYPLLRDPLTVAGMTTDELAAQLIAELRHRGIYERPQVRVSVREYASHAVLVSGLVNDPGTKILRREAIPLYVVIAEAQPRPEAGRAVIISHATGKIINVDLNDAAALNTLVQSGDVVTLTIRPPEFYYVGGEIASPGQKDFHAGLTLTQALLASGGVTRTAGDRVRVARQGGDGRLVSAEYSLREIEGGVVPDPLLLAGDRVEVPRRK